MLAANMVNSENYYIDFVLVLIQNQNRRTGLSTKVRFEHSSAWKAYLDMVMNLMKFDTFIYPNNKTKLPFNS